MAGMADDPRVDDARGRTLREAFDKLHIPGFRQVDHEQAGPCPSCGGKDRFAINLKRNKWLCRQCSPKGGDAIALVQLVQGLDFMGAVEFLEGSEIREISPAERERRRKKREAADRKADREAEQYRRWSIGKAVEIWKAAQPFRGTLAEDYLRARGVDVASLPHSFACFRFLPAHRYVKKIGKRNLCLHTGPALISAIQAPGGKLAAVHQTFIDLSRPKAKAEILHPDTGEALPAKMVQGSKKGGAIRLTGNACASTLVAAEGIETTLTALIADPVPGASFWVLVDLGNMGGKQTPPHSGIPDLTDERAFVPPPCVDRQISIQDGDSDPKKTRACLISGIRRAKHHNPALRGAIVAAERGQDLNDMINDKIKGDE